jgi:hypothetical protein
LAGFVGIAQAVPDDALEAAGADGIEQRLAILERRDEPHTRTLDLEFFQECPPLVTRQGEARCGKTR